MAAINGVGDDSSITYAEIHSELEEVRRILVDLTGTVERLSSIVASVSPQHGAPAPSIGPQPGVTAPANSVPTPGPASTAPTGAPPSPTAAPVAPAPAAPAPPPVAPNPVDAILGDVFGRPT